MTTRDTIRRPLLSMQVLPILFLQQLPWRSSFQSSAIIGPNTIEKNNARCHKVREELLSMP